MTDEGLIFIIFWILAWIVFFGFCALAITGLSDDSVMDDIMRYETELREAKEDEDE